MKYTVNVSLLTWRWSWGEGKECKCMKDTVYREPRMSLDFEWTLCSLQATGCDSNTFLRFFSCGLVIKIYSMCEPVCVSWTSWLRVTDSEWGKEVLNKKFWMTKRRSNSSASLREGEGRTESTGTLQRQLSRKDSGMKSIKILCEKRGYVWAVKWWEILMKTRKKEFKETWDFESDTHFIGHTFFPVTLVVSSQEKLWRRECYSFENELSAD